MKWFPLCNYTHYSLQLGFSKPKQLAKKCSKYGYVACGIADYKSLSGAVAFYQACDKANIKPIIGCAFDDFTLFAKNISGWYDLIEIVSSKLENGEFPTTLMSRVAKKGNLISVGSDESLSPVIGNDFYLKSEAFRESYYTEQSQARLQRILLAGALKTTVNGIKDKCPATFHKFEEDDWHLRDSSEISQVLVDDPKMDLFDEIYSKCTNYNILNPPMLPVFQTPDGLTEQEYLTQLAREGWVRLLQDKVTDDDSKKIYGDRGKKEMKVIEDANLSGYFLIVWDIIKWCVDQGWMVGAGRGSAAGCLISYLVGITQVDPIEFDLLFERFYNPGRNTADRVSLPDIDLDVPCEKRDEIITRLKDKYGHDYVSQMLTFGRLQGRSAIKEVLRAHEACSFGEMNHITQAIPDEAAISDQLQEMDDEDRSIIRWSLINHADDLRDYCFINKNGELEGNYADYFQQAIEMEGTFKNQGKHAAGVVISSQPLHMCCPMVEQRSGGEKIAGLEMNDLEALGHVKFDVLGINLLDKLMLVKELVESRKDA
jgi:DNA polymerase-3 subunit alpha